jgi:predicted O-methyltransferase YrrM
MVMGLGRIRSVAESFSYNEDEYVRAQTKLFADAKLDRDAGTILIESIVSSGNADANYRSEHWTLFASVAASKRFNSARILEIGTHNGVTTKVLALLFPDSVVDTIDLAAGSEEFIKTYDRAHAAARREFLDTRKKNLEFRGNVNFREMDSVFLTKAAGEQYDLIWVDGSHRSPEVVGDIINACRLIRKGGLVFIDDVIFTCNTNNHYRSQAAYDSLEWLRRSGLISCPPLYFYKYVSWPKNRASTRKYVGCLQF